MTRPLSLFALTTVLAACQLGCQTPSMLFGKRDLADRESIAELDADVDEEPSTEVADLVDRADRDFQGQRYDQARTAYERVLHKDPANSHAHHHLAVIADLQEEYRAAEEHYQAALVRDGRNSQILSSMAYSYILQGRFDDAETRLNQARVADPSDRNAASNLALLYACRGDREKCQAIARTLGSADDAESIVGDMFQRAGEISPAKPESDIQLAGAFDIFKKDRRQDPDAVYADGVNQETYELKQRMDAAREAALAGRNQRRREDDPRRRVPSTREVLGVGGVANRNLNDALAEIDRPREPQAPITADPRVRAVAPASNLPAWANPQPGYQPPAEQFSQGDQSPSQYGVRNGGVVNADHVQSHAHGGQRPSQPIIPTQGNEYPNAPPSWPTELDHSRSQIERPASVGGQAGQGDFSRSGYNDRGNNWNQAPQNLGPSAAAPQRQPQASSNGSGQVDARQRAASLGMGTGLGGMFDRYAYKTNPNALNPQQPLAPYHQSTLPPQQRQPFGQSPSSDPRTALAPPNQASRPNLPVNQQNVNQQNSQFDPQAYGTTQQQWPGTNSRLGAMYPEVQRQLPTDRPLAPPTITAGMPAAPNWQGQTLPSSGSYLTGPADYGTTLPSGSAAPTPPLSSFGAPVTNVQPLPTNANIRNGLNSDFNGLQRQMMGSPNLVPTNAYGQQQSATAMRAAASGQSLPTRTGPTNPNIPYYNQNTGPNSGGFQNNNRVGLPSQSQLPSGFVEPPPYRGGANMQNPATGASSTSLPAQTPYSSQQRRGSLPQITPNGQQ